MLETLKKIGVQAVGATSPVAFYFGVISSAAPLSVKIDQKLTLPSAALVLTETLTEKKIRVGIEDIVIREGLKEGDKVLLLRVQGGTSYAVLDRMVDA